MEVLTNILKFLLSPLAIAIIIPIILFSFKHLFYTLYADHNKKYKEMVEKTKINLSYYEKYYLNPLNRMEEKYNKAREIEYLNARKEFEKFVSEIIGYVKTIPRFYFLKIKKFKRLSKLLNGLANGFFQDTEKFNTIIANIKNIDKINALMGYDD